MLLYLLQVVMMFARSAVRPRLGVLEESRVPLRVWPWDLDTNLHLNNGRYLTLMDLGRFDLVIRNGLGRMMLERRWSPVLAAAMIRYRRSLNPFQRFELVTRIVSWDERWFFIEQRFERQGKVMAQAFVRGTFMGKEGTIPTNRLLEATGVAVQPPPMPPSLLAWQQAEEHARNAAT